MLFIANSRCSCVADALNSSHSPFLVLVSSFSSSYPGLYYRVSIVSFSPACWTLIRFIFSSFFINVLSLSFPPFTHYFCVSVFKIRSGLPRHDVDARYSGHRVTSSSGYSEINSSGKVLLVVWPLSLVYLF